MKSTRSAFAIVAALAFALPPGARGQGASPGPGDETGPNASPPTDASPTTQARPAPSSPDPGASAPGAPATSGAPAQPPEAQDRAAERGTPPGQWVRTRQYGWIWIPYSDEYTSVPPDGYGEPYSYVYYPDYGWTWVVAPWVWGYGPWPFFGVFGPARFAWYGHGWWRSPSRWHFRPGHVATAARPWGPYRGGFYRGYVRAAPARSYAVRPSGGSGRGGGHGGARHH